MFVHQRMLILDNYYMETGLLRFPQSASQYRFWGGNVILKNRRLSTPSMFRLSKGLHQERVCS